MYTSLMVPFDGSEFSARALPLAVELARRSGAALHLVMVMDPSAHVAFVPGEVSLPVFDANAVRQERVSDEELLAARVAELQAQGIRAIGTLLEGTVVEELVEHAQHFAVDLTVMTTHGRGGFARLRLGSVASAYIARATAPVLLVHGAGDSAEIPDAQLPTGPLLCPLDGSQFAERCLPHAAKFANTCGIPMALFSVSVPPPIPMAPFATELLLADPHALEVDEEVRSAYLDRVALTCPAGTTTHEVADAGVGSAILDEAARISAEAIAMATHGRGGLMRLVLGSVADELLRHSSLPLLVYRPESAKESAK
jgi:nucleotide-binding universal stress UspA family protein